MFLLFTYPSDVKIISCFIVESRKNALFFHCDVFQYICCEQTLLFRICLKFFMFVILKKCIESFAFEYSIWRDALIHMINIFNNHFILMKLKLCLKKVISHIQHIYVTFYILLKGLLLLCQIQNRQKIVKLLNLCNLVAKIANLSDSFGKAIKKEKCFFSNFFSSLSTFESVISFFFNERVRTRKKFVDFSQKCDIFETESVSLITEELEFRFNWNRIILTHTNNQERKVVIDCSIHFTLNCSVLFSILPSKR
ncbi:hypothetical protein RFI_32337, partial [Reticulomyxa filosa]